MATKIGKADYPMDKELEAKKREAYLLFKTWPEKSTYQLVKMMEHYTSRDVLRKWRNKFNNGEFEMYAPQNPQRSSFNGYDYGNHLKSGATYVITKVVRMPKGPYDGLKVTPKHDPDGWLENYAKAGLKE